MSPVTYVGPPVGPGQLLPKITIQGRAQTPGNWENCAGIKATGAADTVAGDDKACTPFVITHWGHPTGIDLVAKKTPFVPGGGGFNLNAVNAGAPLPAGSVIQIHLELRAARHDGCRGRCGGALGMHAQPTIGPPVTGPDVIVCTMTVGAGGIPTGGSLPSDSDQDFGGQWECPNCMRVRVRPFRASR